ncbi:MAG: DNA repair protein RecN [Firmicutes bacterium]|nr:DNA repair protein RecN [Bacillota bacterium]
MLVNLFVKNFGLISSLNMDLQPGLNVLTGETGAGKSIIIEALQVALGGRASGEMIRTGEDKALVQATFDVAGAGAVAALLADTGIEVPEDAILTLSREISRTGRNICRVNGLAAGLAVYRALARVLVDMHGQHEQHSLLDPSRQLSLLDRFGSARIGEALAATASAYQRRLAVRRRYDQLCGDPAARAARADLLRYQCGEIEKAGLFSGEEEALAAERKILVSGEKVQRLIAGAYAALYEGERGRPGAVDLLAHSAGYIKELADIDPQLKPLFDSLENALFLVEDVARELAACRERLDLEPGRLEAVEDRLEIIRRLKKKYGRSVDEVLAYAARARAELEAMENSEALVKETAVELAAAEEEYRTCALLLRERRREAAVLLEEAVKAGLEQLEMGRVDFKVGFEGRPEPAPDGLDQINFLISPNPGEPLKPLAKIASGGELSRVMLALKAILAEGDDIPTLVFDEVDSGIGGRALQAVAEKLARIGDYRQVLCVTHAAQVAARAHAHFYIEKGAWGGRTETRVALLDESARVDELARMLAGGEVGGVVREHAVMLLKAVRR